MMGKKVKFSVGTLAYLASPYSHAPPIFGQQNGKTAHNSVLERTMQVQEQC